ncbi:MAG: tRNA uridine-5-carboxymethylaminomethyl(34) synthesis GTPase MnmE [Melioribacteraceae bacterium]|nr:tRNA uridine-5-carboxymethylaminomethyl(34) synthesis GTPase MnmE [Melioribacteraceae bacterium]MCF8263066.1 tRNA uridine-5-carboxymethylaminomethyl(34) synthesis GTPase MnmE [Melioribacteraceae bacterium]MCF8414322.1 tRNA uridine-5-carboxymethylaminomethyl(34) synthesis GTPase MnmE [Melioribacteraceae bacterium]MCF8431214.1 tRNA uridine-5-carboxymethylaminomethyl(34) synthesis GTPase MnmE [Melioribacteraceae bacterium]
MAQIQFSDDTITALATPPGSGAISVIRISGPDSFSVTDKIFRGKGRVANADSHTILYGKILSSRSEVIDDVLVSVFRNPNSFTGEDSVEISTHGSPLISQKIIALLLEYNIRLAEPGEFTRRAFMNGKLDLSQAEAVLDVINARTSASLKGARNQLDGLLSIKVKLLRDSLINASSLVELELDFSEEDVEFVDLSALRTRIIDIKTEIEKLISSYSIGKVVRDGINVALVGKPNVGKSSLLNYMVKEARAIVSEIPGTTRDIISEEVTYNGFLFKLFDTAGIRLTDDFVEKEGVIRSREAIKRADVVLFINDVVSGFSLALYNELVSISDEERIVTVINKVDLNLRIDTKGDAFISALTGEGIDDLFNLMKEKTIGSDVYSEKSAVVTNIRHYNALVKTTENLERALDSLDEKLSGEFISVDLRNAESSLGEIIGEVTTDDILNNIFANFCIGK